MCLHVVGYISSRQLVFIGTILFLYRDKEAPSVGQRQVCYAARDAFYRCLVENGESEELCLYLKETYHKSCLQSWVSIDIMSCICIPCLYVMLICPVHHAYTHALYYVLYTMLISITAITVLIISGEIF